MVSRVPGYGHLEYLVLGLSCESHHVILINLLGFNDDAKLGLRGCLRSQCLTTTTIVIKFYSFEVGKIGFTQNYNHRAFHQPNMHIV